MQGAAPGSGQPQTGVIPLCSALVKPHREPCVQPWGPQHEEDVDVLEWVPSGLELGMFSLKKRQLQEDLTAAFQHLKGAYEKDGEQLFTWANNDKTWGEGFKLKERRYIFDVRRKFFTRRVVRHWCRLPREAVDAPSLEVFKTWLDETLGSLI